jgi:uncharacterized protein
MQSLYDFEFNVKIPMKDGINLGAKIWKPINLNNKIPAILMLTPYIADEGHSYGSYFAQNGYVFICVDCRGRGDSEGEFYPLEQDGPDGIEIIEWISQQPWCDGRVAMMGGSYRGMVQWQTLKYFPTALKTIVPTASVGPGIDYPQPKNIFYSFAARWMSYVGGKTSNPELFSDESYWRRKYHDAQTQGVSFSHLSEFCGITPKIFKRWLSHPTFDDYWREMMPSSEDYSKFNIPIMTITGHFDDDQPGAMTYYLNHKKYGTKECFDNHYLVVGPWDHPGTRNPKNQLSNMTFGDNSLIEMKNLHLEWFDWILKDGPKPEFLKKRVSYYMLNENQWHYANKIEDISDDILTLYLTSGIGNSPDKYHSGILSEALDSNVIPDTFEYDPSKTIDFEKYFSDMPIYPLDQNESGNVLTYFTKPIDEEIEIAGYCKMKVFIEMNVQDADFYINLYQISNSGECNFLAGDILRTRYRNSLENEELITPGEIIEYTFDNFFLFSAKIQIGSRLKVVFGCLNSPEYEKNYNSWKNIADETKEDARKTIVKLYHDSTHPSRIEFPVKK